MCRLPGGQHPGSIQHQNQADWAYNRDDIEIIFRRESWKANGEFAQTDVHRQIAIVFKTPPYEDQEITEEVEVNLALRRISDQMESEPVTFKYLPRNPGYSKHPLGSALQQLSTLVLSQ
ncbi:transcription factor RelB-like [Simochromis diagramma]|uniref:transcription factor RelB-like n=1 Tax=Simochromis diagramma TaxID=43689 RepID=UPI001A7E3E1D|nr:transcription factor RelB-like [Simochromis diagramma]